MSVGPGPVAAPGIDRAHLAATARARSVLVVGSLNLDLILHAERQPEDESAALVSRAVTAPGGHAANCASAFAALGLRTGLVAAVGDDDDGRRLVEDLADRGVRTSGVAVKPGAPTGRAYIPVFGEHHYMLIDRGANDLLDRADVESAGLGDADLVVVFDPGPDALRAVLDEVGRSARRPLLCWNPGGLLAREDWVRELLPGFDILIVNTAELGGLLGSEDDGSAGPESLEIVVTRGRQGATHWLAGIRRDRGTHPVVPVDPVGAGDAFAASFLFGRLAGLGIDDCLEMGNRAGRLAVGAVGARGRLVAIDEVADAPSAAAAGSATPAVTR